MESENTEKEFIYADLVEKKILDARERIKTKKENKDMFEIYGDFFKEIHKEDKYIIRLFQMLYHLNQIKELIRIDDMDKESEKKFEDIEIILNRECGYRLTSILEGKFMNFEVSDFEDSWGRSWEESDPLKPFYSEIDKIEKEQAG